MKKLKEQIAQWREVTPVQVSIDSLITDEGLQPRNPQVTSFNDSPSEEKATRRHIEALSDVLQVSKDAELAPLLGADIEGRRYVVDGHHRYKAYSRAGRKTVPVRLMSMTLEHASLLSKLVNTDETKLRMSKGQCSEAMWQYLAKVTERGRHKLKDLGLTGYQVAAEFGIASRNTVSRMMRRMEETAKLLKEGYWPEQWCDPITKWPRWKVACGGSKGKPWADVPLSAREEAKKAKCRKVLAKALEDFGPERIATSLREMGYEQLAELTEQTEPEETETEF